MAVTDTCEFCGKPFGTTGGSFVVVNEGDCDCEDWALAHARKIGHLRRKYVDADRACDAARKAHVERALLALFAEES